MAILEKRKIFILLLYLFSVIFFLNCNSNIHSPKTIHGVLNLENWSFLEDGNVPLDGEWEFYWKNFYRLKDINALEKKLLIEKNKQFVQVPNSWNKYKKDNQAISNIGFATYHLKILLKSNLYPLAFRIKEVHTAYKLYINGKLIAQQGDPGKTKDATIPQIGYSTIYYKSNQKTLDIIFQVSNFHFREGGFRKSIFIGNNELIHKEFDKLLYIDIFFLGAFFVIGLYYLFLFRIRRNEKENLFFALFNFVIVYRTIFTGDIIIKFLFPDLSYNIIIFNDYLSFFLTVSIFFRFFYILFPSELKKIIHTVTQIMVGIHILFILFFESYIYTQFIFIFKFYTLLIGIYSIFISLHAILKKREGAKTFFFGYIFLISSAVVDILFNSYTIDYGLFIFIFSQMMILSSRFIKAFETNSRLKDQVHNQSLELKKTNSKLELLYADQELELKRRTQKLINANENLKKIHETMNQDMQMAINIQMNFLPNKAPEVDDWDISFVFRPMAGVSGDLFDFYTNKNQLLGISLFDVSGHGIASGLLTMIAKSIAFRTFNNGLYKPLSTVMDKINSQLIKEIGNLNNYLTGLMLRFKDNRIEYVNAGHLDILVKRNKKNTIEIIRPPKGKFNGSLLGIPYLTDSYECIKFYLEPGDSILCFTDCLFESENENEELFGKKLLQETFLKQPSSLSAEEQLSNILDEFYHFTNNYELNDDLTVILLKKK